MRLRDIVRQWFTPKPPPAPPTPPAPKPPVVVPPPPPGPPDPVDPVRLVFELQNKTRDSYDLPALAWDPRAAAAAQRHIEECAGRGKLTHTGKNGSNVGERLRDAGLYWTSAGENIAAGQPTAEAVIRAWFNSPDHRSNMLNENYTVCGVGTVAGVDGTVWWCVAFARARVTAMAALLETADLPYCPGPLLAGAK